MAFRVGHSSFIGLCAIIIVLAAVFPTQIVHDFVDSLFGRILLIGFALYGVTLGPLTGVLSLLAVMALFVERNRYSIYQAKTYIMSRGSKPTLSSMEPHDEPAEVNGKVVDESWVGHDTPVGDMDSWSPLEPGESEDYKEVIDSQTFPNERMNGYYVEHGLANSELKN
jgi:hypothetical protein